MNNDAAAFLRESLSLLPVHQWLQPELAVAEEGRSAVVRLPLRPEFRRDPQRPKIHGGIIAALIDIAEHAAIAVPLPASMSMTIRTAWWRLAAPCSRSCWLRGVDDTI